MYQFSFIFLNPILYSPTEITMHYDGGVCGGIKGGEQKHRVKIKMSEIFLSFFSNLNRLFLKMFRFSFIQTFLIKRKKSSFDDFRIHLSIIISLGN